MDKLGQRERFNRWALIVALCVAVFLLLLNASSQAAQQRARARPAPAQPKPAAPASTISEQPPAVIALADIAAQGTEVSKLLGNLTTAAATGSQIENIAILLPDVAKELDQHVAATTTTLASEPTLETLQALEQEWQGHQLETTRSLNVLTQQATQLQKALSQLADLQKIWSATLTFAQTSKAPDPILQQIDITLTAIATAQSKIQSERTAILDLQSRAAKEVNKCGAVLAQIGQYQQKAVAGIFVPDAAPLWRVELWADALRTLPEHVRNIAHSRWSDFFRYVREPREGIALHAALFVALALLFSAARRKINGWKTSDVPLSPVLLVFNRHFSAALAATLLIATSPFFRVSAPVRQFLTVIALIPMVRLVRPVVTPAVAAAFNVSCVLFAVETMRQGYGSIQVIGQMFLVAETVAAIAAVFWMRHHSRQIIAERTESCSLIFLKSARFFVMVALVLSLVAGAAGYLRLARLLTPGVLVGAVLALGAITYLRVGGGVVALAFRLWPLRLLRMVEYHRDFLERRIYTLLVWFAILGWLIRYLSYLGLLDPVWSAGQVLLTTKLERGTISISLGNIVEFLLSVASAYLLSVFLRFALKEDVYPRIHLAPGLSYAVSSLLNYIILALGFIAGLGVLGVDLSKVSILAGAFGVGMGFGLQSIVNNFVSGLILLFERPIHVGDAVEVGSLQGTVRRIGIRASVIHTSAGADIVVPNSQLVTDKVTNWTLSDRLRRVELPVGVNYGADPKKVIELLERTARAHPGVLTDPAPHVLFIGYGDSSINFQLQVWPASFNQCAQVKSDLAAAVYDAVNAAGMSFPFPQREVRVLQDGRNESVASAAEVKNESIGRYQTFKS